MERRRNVALIVETSVAYGRDILKGISRYMRTNGGWSIFLDERELMAPPPDWLLNWDGNGIICRPTTPALAENFGKLRIPFIDLNDRFGPLGHPWIGTDMEAVGRIATDHLLDRGFQHIAFCGYLGEAWSDARLTGVAAQTAGRATLHREFLTPFRALREYSWEQEREAIADWLRRLPRPLGIVACNDARGYHVLDACRLLGLAVPEEVAVIGVDNAETFCELCDPPLSSVLPDAERVGYEAAWLLDRLMTGETPPNTVIAVPPIGVVTRQSTDSFAIDDPVIARAVHWVRRHACGGIGVEDVAASLSLSRSSLERGFRRHLGHSPHEEIRATQLRRVRELLRQTDWPLERIASAAGYDHPEYMMVQFKRTFGMTPTEWRRSELT